MNDPYMLQMIVALVVLLLLLIPGIFYLITLQNTLKAISPESRMMAPSNVWLLFIPLFNIVYYFIVVARMADSIRNECIRLNIPLQEERPTYTLGLIMLITYIASTILNYTSLFGPFNGLGSIVCIVLWIIYWVKVNNYKKLIIANRDNFMFDAEKELAQSQE